MTNYTYYRLSVVGEGGINSLSRILWLKKKSNNSILRINFLEHYNHKND